MSERLRETYAEVDLKALAHNLAILKASMAANQFICPMVKANAYGHGDVEVARVLEKQKVPALGVVLVEEGVNLRRAGIQTPILVFGHFENRVAEIVTQEGLTPVVSTWDHIKSVERIIAENANFPVHLKINTGMSRLGFPSSDAHELAKYIRSQTRLRVEGLCTHLFQGDDADSSTGNSANQIRIFREVLRHFQGLKYIPHALNSAATLLKSNQDLGSRPGLALYGISPFSSDHKTDFNLKPMMTLKTQIAFTRKVKKGETVSYGGTWKAPKDSEIAILPIGYADGISRLLSNKGKVLVRGRKVPIVGIVCMDYIMVDISSVVEKGPINPSEEVVLLGSQGGVTITAHEIADLIGGVPYEVVTGISYRVPRVFV